MTSSFAWFYLCSKDRRVSVDRILVIYKAQDVLREQDNAVRVLTLASVDASVQLKYLELGDEFMEKIGTQFI